MCPNPGVDYFRTHGNFPFSSRRRSRPRNLRFRCCFLRSAPRIDRGVLVRSRPILDPANDHRWEEVRRSYSLCSAPRDGKWQVGIKKVPGGKFSTFANDVLDAGIEMDVMDPQGRFLLKEGAGLHHLGMAAGSGITPILSQIKQVLSEDPSATYTLFYSNKTAASTMFREGASGLEGSFPRSPSLVLLADP